MNMTPRKSPKLQLSQFVLGESNIEDEDFDQIDHKLLPVLASDRLEKEKRNKQLQ